jgi:SAM-dependent methyltransferase
MSAAAPACNLCGSTEARVLFEAEGYPILKCSRCGLAFTGVAGEQHAVEAFYRDVYYAEADEYAACLKSHAAAPREDYEDYVRVAGRLARRQTGRVLDVGCASGRLLAAFQRAGWQCTGIEPSAELAAVARQAVGCPVHQDALESVALPAEPFDVVTALHVLEHTRDPRRFLGCCHGLLRKDGVLILEVPDFGSRAAQRQRESWRPLYPNTHLYHFTLETLTGLLAAAGFRVVRFRRHGGLGLLDHRSAPDAAGAPPAPDRLKRRLFEARHALYRFPPLKRALRYAYWHVLRMNDLMSVFAVKTGGTTAG